MVIWPRILIMPTLDEAITELENFFTVGWAGRTPIVYDSITKDPLGENEWVRVVTMPYSSRNATIGNSIMSGGIVREKGVLVVSINVEINVGSGRAWKLSDQVKKIMVNKGIISNVWTGNGNVRRSGAEPNGYYGLIVSVDFTADDIQ